MVSNVSRRDFLKYCGTIAAVIGLSRSDGIAIAEAAEDQGKPPLYWIEAQACGGCQRSFFNSENPDAARLLLELLGVQYLTSANSRSGIDLITDVLPSDQAEGQRAARPILVVEGSLPLGGGGRFCVVGNDGSADISASTLARRLSNDARAIIAAGSCAAYGGIPGAEGGDTGATRLSRIIPDKQVVNIPGCPPHPDWLVATIMHVLLFNSIPERDRFGRPKMFYRHTVHDLCERRAAFDEGRLIDSFSDLVPGDDRCLLNMGCKGPITHGDCPRRSWNGASSWCVGAGGPCHGCTEPEFYEGMSPLLSRVPGITPAAGGTRSGVDTVGKVVVGGTAAVIAGHAAFSGATRFIESRRKESESLTDHIKGKRGGKSAPGDDRGKPDGQNG